MVAFGLAGGPVIIERSPRPTSRPDPGAISFKAWLGIRAKDPEGWEEDSTIFKSYGSLAVSEATKTAASPSVHTVAKAAVGTLSDGKHGSPKSVAGGKLHIISDTESDSDSNPGDIDHTVRPVSRHSDTRPIEEESYY
jgi:hypothetical protein